MPGKNLFEKILYRHGIKLPLKQAETLELPVDQTLTQDATGTLACLQFEALGVSCVRTRQSVSYVDHNTFQACLLYTSDAADE